MSTSNRKMKTAAKIIATIIFHLLIFRSVDLVFSSHHAIKSEKCSSTRNPFNGSRFHLGPERLKESNHKLTFIKTILAQCNTISPVCHFGQEIGFLAGGFRGGSGGDTPLKMPRSSGATHIPPSGGAGFGGRTHAWISLENSIQRGSSCALIN